MAAFVNKWIHVMSVITMLGGVAFAWFVLIPGLRGVDPSQDEIARTLWRRFGITLTAAWALVLVTGFYNLYLVTPEVNGIYQMYLGMKIVLAISMLALSMALTHPARLFERIQSNRAPYILGLLILGVAVVGISAHLNMGRINGSLLKAKAPSPAPLRPGPGNPFSGGMRPLRGPY